MKPPSLFFGRDHDRERCVLAGFIFSGGLEEPQVCNPTESPELSFFISYFCRNFVCKQLKEQKLAL